MERLGRQKAVEDGLFKFPVIAAIEYGLYILARKEGIDLPSFPIYIHYAVVSVGGGIATVIKYEIDLLVMRLRGED